MEEFSRFLFRVWNTGCHGLTLQAMQTSGCTSSMRRQNTVNYYRCPKSACFDCKDDSSYQFMITATLSYQNGIRMECARIHFNPGRILFLRNSAGWNQDILMRVQSFGKLRHWFPLNWRVGFTVFILLQALASHPGIYARLNATERLAGYWLLLDASFMNFDGELEKRPAHPLCALRHL